MLDNLGRVALKHACLAAGTISAIVARQGLQGDQCGRVGCRELHTHTSFEQARNACLQAKGLPIPLGVGGELDGNRVVDRNRQIVDRGALRFEKQTT